MTTYKLEVGHNVGGAMRKISILDILKGILYSIYNFLGIGGVMYIIIMFIMVILIIAMGNSLGDLLCQSTSNSIPPIIK
jgi:hypothetical protein